MAPARKTYVAIICHFLIKNYLARIKKQSNWEIVISKKDLIKIKGSLNFCVSLLQKTKKNYYANLNHNDIADNKQLWRTVKTLLSDKPKSNEKITLVQDNKIIREDKDNTELLNSFFSNGIKNLKILEFSDSNPLTGINNNIPNIPHSIFKAILKYINHQSIIAKNSRNRPGFYFCGVSVNDNFIVIKRLKARKAIQITDIPVKILKENVDTFSAYICDFLNETIRSGRFPLILKNDDITAVFKTVLRDIR